MKPLRCLVSSVLVLSLALCQCGSSLQRRVEITPVWSKGESYIRLLQETGDPKGYDHPWTFYEKEMREILLSLYHSRYQYMRWATSSRVFEEEKADTLAPFFQRAFLEAGPDDVVEFHLPYRAPKLFGLTGRTVLTQGRAFVQDRKLNVRFFHVQEPVLQERDSLAGTEPAVAWKLVPQSGQGYGPVESRLGSGRRDQHWIVIDLDAVFPAAAAPAVTPAPESPPTPAVVAPVPAAPVHPEGERGLAERFEELKRLLDRGLITQKDFDEKKQELLDAL